MSDMPPISYEQMRSLVLEDLSRSKGGQLATLRMAVAKLAADRGLLGPTGGRPHWSPQSDPQLSTRDAARIQNIWWDLCIEGVVRPGLGDGMNNDLPFFHVTELGEERLKGGPAAPYDPDGYFRRIRDAVPDLDPVIETYLTESLRTFRIHCLLSSAVCLGCASEKALLLLIDATAGYLPEPARGQFVKKTAGKFIKTQFDELNSVLESRIEGNLDRDLRADLDVKLSGVFSLIREQRNLAGHPSGNVPDREQLYAALTVFPTYLTKVYGLIHWLNENAPS